MSILILVAPSTLWAENYPIAEDLQGSWAESYAKCGGTTKLVVNNDSIELMDEGKVTRIKEYLVVRSCYGGASSNGDVICILVDSGELDLIDIDTRNGSATPQKSKKGNEDFSLTNIKLIRCN